MHRDALLNFTQNWGLSEKQTSDHRSNTKDSDVITNPNGLCRRFRLRGSRRAGLENVNVKPADVGFFYRLVIYSNACSPLKVILLTPGFIITCSFRVFYL